MLAESIPRIPLKLVETSRWRVCTYRLRGERYDYGHNLIAGGISVDCFSLCEIVTDSINSNLEQQLCHSQYCGVNHFWALKKDISEADALASSAARLRGLLRYTMHTSFELLDESAILWIFCYNYRASENLDCGT